MMKTEQRHIFLTQVIITSQQLLTHMQQLTIFLRRNLRSQLKKQTLYLYTHQITQTPM